MVRRHRRGFKLSGLISGLLMLATLAVVVFLGIKFGPTVLKQNGGGYSRYTIALNQDPLLIVSLDAKRKQAAVIAIPSDLLINAAHGYGKLAVGKIYTAGELDKKGSVVLQDSLAQFLGLNIDTVINPKGNLVAKRPTRLAFLNFNFLLAPGSNPLSLFSFATDWAGLRSDKIRLIDLGETDITSDLVLADGSVVRVVEESKLDRALGNSMFSSKIVAEGLRVGIVNSTAYNGLGSVASRFLSNQGTNVISVDSTDSDLAGCEIQYSNQQTEKTETFKLSRDYFSCRGTLTSSLDSRFDMLIILGKLFAQRSLSL